MLTEILVNFGKKYKFAKGHLLDASFLFFACAKQNEWRQ
jgi:hypothetical protein